MIGTKTFKLGSVLVIQSKYLRFLNCFSFPSPKSSKFPVDISVLSQHSHRKRFMGNFYVEIKVLSQINCCQHKKIGFRHDSGLAKFTDLLDHGCIWYLNLHQCQFKFSNSNGYLLLLFRLILNFKKVWFNWNNNEVEKVMLVVARI